MSRLSIEVNPDSIDDSLPNVHILNVEIILTEYADVLLYLTTNTFPLDYNKKQKQQVIYKSRPYTIITQVLYKQGRDGVLRRCINPSEVSLILKGCHDDMFGGHFADLVIAQKALQSGYWWPTLFLDATKYAKTCDPCQRVGKPTPSRAMCLTLILAQIPFEKWGIDFVGPIKSPSRYNKIWYILVATEYVTKLAEAVATKIDDAKIVAKFIYENIITCFGCPKELVSNRGTHFLNSTIEQLTDKWFIKHKETTPYHPRANGQTKKINCIFYCKLFKDLIQIGIKNYMLYYKLIDALLRSQLNIPLSN